MTLRSAVLAFPAIALVAATGCGSGTVAAQPEAAKPKAAQPETGDAAATAPPIVRIADFTYRPARIVVRRGTRVRWVNRDMANHTVTFKRGPGDLGNLDRGQHRSARFTHAGTYRYVCEYHPSMHGTVVVR